MMSNGLSEAEKSRVFNYLDSESGARRTSAISSRTGFFAWLKDVGLAYVVVKIAQWAWTAIKGLFGFA